MPPHIALVAFPFSSHVGVLLSIARALAAAAPAGTALSFLTTAESVAQLQKAGALPGNLRFVVVPDGAPPPSSSQTRRVELFMDAAEAGGVSDGLEAARSSAGGARVSSVVGDAFVWMAADAAAAAGAKWVPVWTASSCALLAHLRTDALRDDFGDQAASRADELLTAHAGLGGHRVRDLPDGLVSGDFNQVVNLLFHRMAQRSFKHASAVALNTFPGVDPPDLAAALAAELPNSLPVGPYHLLPGAKSDETPSDPHGCIAWLNRHPARSVVYVSFGTVASPQPDEVRELAAGLEASGAPFLWSLREELWPLLPAGFPERAAGLVVPWAPQVWVLRHASVGAFVTHAGWGSVLEGVSSGVPMACRPFFGDQTMNARSVASVWGFGTAFDGPMTRGGVANAVTTLLGGVEGERMRANAQELQAMMGKAFQPDGGCTKNFHEFVKIVCRV
ncbi:unnamed protein product [Alopecurus aequalis]